MYIMQYIGDFLLSQWIWCVTFNLSHFVFAFFLMFIILAVATKERLTRIALITFSSYIFSFGFLFFLGVGFLSWMCNWCCNNHIFNPVITTQWDVINTNLITSALLTLFQAIFFYMLSCIFTLHMRSYLIIAAVSNVVAAWFAYVHILITMRSLF